MNRLPLCLALVSMFGSGWARAQNENLAFGAAIVERSGDFNGNFTAEKVVDGAVRDLHQANTGGVLANTSYWLTPDGQGSSAYFVADLGTSQQIGEILLRPTSNSSFDDRGTLEFQVRGGDDLAEISGLAPTAPVILSGALPNVTGAAAAGLIHPLERFDGATGLTEGSYRYLRFESITAINNNGGLGELIARSSTGNIALGRPIVDGSGAWQNGTVADPASPYDAGGFAAAHANDGVSIESETLIGGGEGDWWLGRQATANEFFTIDLEEPKQIERIDLLNTHNRQFNDRGTADFNIQASTDGTVFTPIVSGTMTDATGTGAALPLDTFSVGGGDFTAFSARFIRFEAETLLGDSAGLNEIRIFQDAAGDTDADGLLDDWETTHFGDLTRDGSEDEDMPEPDGLTNKREHDLGLDPNDPDSDDDTLSDGDEVDVHGTNPLLADSDGDDLDDPDEINTHGTDPNSADTDLDQLGDADELFTHSTNPLLLDSDMDGWADPTELAAASDANDAGSAPFLSTTVGPFAGADPGEGLDFFGDFTYAFNVGSNGAPGLIGDADFVQYDVATGATVGFQFDAPTWNPAASFGDSAGDDALELMMNSILWASADGLDAETVTVDLSGLTPGTGYKLQLLWDEACCPNRGFDVTIEDALVADEFSPGLTQGEPRARTGAVLTHDFVAGDDVLNIVLDGTATTTPELTDSNAILQGLTLEQVGPGADFEIISVSRGEGSLTLEFNSIDEAPYWIDASFDGQIWDEIDDGVVGTGSVTTFVDINPARLKMPLVLYRVRNFSLE